MDFTDTNFDVNKKSAFTLAETLITLGIIGIIAALALPAIINNYKNELLKTALKKNATVISQAVQIMFTNLNLDCSPNYFGKDELKPKLISYLKYTEACEGVHYDHGFNCISLGPLKKIYTTFNGNESDIGNFLDDGQIILADGSMIFFENTDRDLSYYDDLYDTTTIINEEDRNLKLLFISVDVNGYSKGPNRLGHDLFVFQVTQKGVQPMGAEGTLFTNDEEYCSNSSTSKYNGISCTYRALHEKDYFKHLR